MSPRRTFGSGVSWESAYGYSRAGLIAPRMRIEIEVDAVLDEE